MKKIIILISGKQGSGKTTLAKSIRDYFRKEKGWLTKRFRFAQPIYEMHDAVWKVMNEYGFERKSIKDGPLLQLLGTEWGRETIDVDIWVKCCQNSINQHFKRVKNFNCYEVDGCLITIEDARFENEFEGINFTLSIRLNADEKIRRERCEAWRENIEHRSEIGLDEFDSSNKFDLYIDTGILSKEESCNTAITALDYILNPNDL